MSLYASRKLKPMRATPEGPTRAAPTTNTASPIMATPSAPNSKDLDVHVADCDPKAMPNNYVEHVLATQKALPPITWSNWYQEINALNCFILVGTPLLGLTGAFFTKLRWETAIFAVAYYFFTGLGITAGYHRLWCHRAYNASEPLQYVLAFAGAGAVQGSIKWWSTKHRAHHRYTDTDLDPYSAHKGIFWAHFGWMLVKPRRKAGVADISDLRANKIVKWQHENYIVLLLTMAYVLPTVVCGLGWGDWKGGYVYAALLRLCFVHHSTFAVNSLAHYLGESTFDDKHSPRDHLITALVTIGEGYHNFHHQFPMDYRNAIKWYQYDPTKWFIKANNLIGQASHLKVFPDNEVQKGVLTMQLKKLRDHQETLAWPTSSNDLPVVNWQAFQEQSKKRPLVLIAGFIHDLSGFMDEHPGGRALLHRNIGKDATTAFFGGVYDHSNAAHNLLAMKRVGILQGGLLHGLDDRSVPPSQRLKIAQYSELATPYGNVDSSTEVEMDEEMTSKGDSLFD